MSIDYNIKSNAIHYVPFTYHTGESTLISTIISVLLNCIHASDHTVFYYKCYNYFIAALVILFPRTKLAINNLTDANVNNSIYCSYESQS
jgi:hypothetical protein